MDDKDKGKDKKFPVNYEGMEGALWKMGRIVLKITSINSYIPVRELSVQGYP